MKFAILFVVMMGQAWATVVTNDKDLASLQLLNQKIEVSQTLTPDDIVSEDIRNPQGLSVEFVVRKDGQEWTLTDSPLPAGLCSQAESERSWNHRFENSKFAIQNNRSVYQLQLSLECGKNHKLIFDHDSNAGQVVRMWEIFTKAQKKLADIERLDFWKRKIKVQWPGRGDYYQFGTVNITSGHHWDVVGHELGHAIYDQARIGAFGGGSHRIDECYSNALALSEGWASYFSAWLSIALDDEDAKFEYLVPRRAPIRIEHVPADVCAAPTNEWRVSSFLWDLIDLNVDDESADKTFQELWDKTLNKGFRSIRDLAISLRDTGWDPVLVGAVWSNNFLQDL